MAREFWVEWGVPVVALAFGLFSFSLAWLGSWQFDRRYGRPPR
jgi:hypothetical protein